MRIVIAGVPRAGKTTLADRLAAPVRHTDDLVASGAAWSDASLIVARWFDDPGPWIVEGVAAVRSLRKWMAAYPDPACRPCDTVIWMPTPRIPLSSGQLTMAKGCITIWNEIEPKLVARGVHVESPI